MSPRLPGNLQSQRLISTSSSLAATLGAGLLCWGRPGTSLSQYHKIIKIHGRLASQTVGTSSPLMVPVSISLLHGVTAFRVALLRDCSSCPLPGSPGAHRSCCKPKCTNTDWQKGRKSQAIPHAPYSSTQSSFSLLLTEQATGFGDSSHPQHLTLPTSGKASLQHLLHWGKSVRETLFCWLCTSKAAVKPPKKELGLFLEVLSVLGSTKTVLHGVWIFLFSCCYWLNTAFSSALSSQQQSRETTLFLYMHINHSVETRGKSKWHS